MKNARKKRVSIVGIGMNANATKRKGSAHRSLSQAIRYSLWVTSDFLVRASFVAVVKADRRAHRIHRFTIKEL
jgi:hypothetical protein